MATFHPSYNTSGPSNNKNTGPSSVGLVCKKCSFFFQDAEQLLYHLQYLHGMPLFDTFPQLAGPPVSCPDKQLTTDPSSSSSSVTELVRNFTAFPRSDSGLGLGASWRPLYKVGNASSITGIDAGHQHSTTNPARLELPDLGRNFGHHGALTKDGFGSNGPFGGSPENYLWPRTAAGGIKGIGLDPPTMAPVVPIHSAFQMPITGCRPAGLSNMFRLSQWPASAFGQPGLYPPIAVSSFHGIRSDTSPHQKTVPTSSGPAGVPGSTGRSSEEKMKRFPCDICGKTFVKKYSMETHRHLHTGTKPFKCELCDYATAQKSKVDRHMKTHRVLGGPSLLCQFCQTPFVQTMSLNKHVRSCPGAVKKESQALETTEQFKKIAPRPQSIVFRQFGQI